MEEPRFANGGSAASIALVAPIWLQDALQVLLDGTSGVMLIASATDVDSLTLLEMERAPDFVLLDADRESQNAASEVGRITHLWPKTECVALVDNSGQIQLLKDAGASLILLKGATPQRLREVLQTLAEHKRSDNLTARPLTSQL